MTVLISGLIRLAELENNTTLTLVQPSRLTIIRQPGQGFALNIEPSRTGDSGTYFCLVNGHQEPFSAFQLAIQGMYNLYEETGGFKQFMELSIREN